MVSIATLNDGIVNDVSTRISSFGAARLFSTRISSLSLRKEVQ